MVCDKNDGDANLGFADKKSVKKYEKVFSPTWRRESKFPFFFSLHNAEANSMIFFPRKKWGIEVCLYLFVWMRLRRWLHTYFNMKHCVVYVIFDKIYKYIDYNICYCLNIFIWICVFIHIIQIVYILCIYLSITFTKYLKDFILISMRK